jgi:D-xylose transport system ATP-binding protein
MCPKTNGRNNNFYICSQIQPVPYLEVKQLSKSFNSVPALAAISISFEKGEVHGICGENGAGKSTLIKILGGIYPAETFDGTITLNEKKQNFPGVKDAEKAGIAVIHQELALVEHMSIAENIFLGREPNTAGVINFTEMNSVTSNLLSQLGLTIPPETLVIQLSIGEQQLVEIAKALNKKAEVLIFDEPTTALSEQEVAKLMTIIRELKSKGVTIIYISHKLREVLSLTDRISVMRDGQLITTKKSSEFTEKELVSLMVGREITDFYPKAPHTKGDVVLSIKNLTLYDAELTTRKKIDSVSFNIFKGEILGIAGLMGSGRTELLTGIFGAWNGKKIGSIIFKGQETNFKSPHQAIESGIALVTEDRKRFGLVVNSSIAINLNLASLKSIAGNGILSFVKETRRSVDIIKDLAIKCQNQNAEVNTLSGGNQQKVVLGKWLLTNPDVLFLDEPTRGIDVGAKAEIYEVMNKLVANGMAVVMVSSDLPEVLGMSDRILVLHEGKLTGEFSGSSATQQNIMLAATGQEEILV